MLLFFTKYLWCSLCLFFCFFFFCFLDSSRFLLLLILVAFPNFNVFSARSTARFENVLKFKGWPILWVSQLLCTVFFLFSFFLNAFYFRILWSLRTKFLFFVFLRFEFFSIVVLILNGYGIEIRQTICSFDGALRSIPFMVCESRVWMFHTRFCSWKTEQNYRVSVEFLFYFSSLFRFLFLFSFRRTCSTIKLKN